MLKLFTPKYYIHRYDVITPEYLKAHGISVLLCDIDNTLVAHDIALPDEQVIMFLKRLKEAGIHVIFVSNNVEERVKTFVEGCGLQAEFYPFAMKPLSKTYRKILKDYGFDRKQVAMLGDQLMTDILGANWMGFYTILTAPVVQRDLSFTKVNRVFESAVFYLLKVTGKLKKGDYDA